MEEFLSRHILAVVRHQLCQQEPSSQLQAATRICLATGSEYHLSCHLYQSIFCLFVI